MERKRKGNRSEVEKENVTKKFRKKLIHDSTNEKSALLITKIARHFPRLLDGMARYSADDDPRMKVLS